MSTTNTHTIYPTNEAGVPPAPPEAHQRADFEVLSNEESERIKDYFGAMSEFISADLFKNKDEVKEVPEEEKYQRHHESWLWD